MVPIQETEQEINTIRVGTKLLRQLSSTFYPHPQVIFDELVSNALDAGATEIKISIQSDSITIEDNGEGMSHGGLIRFFYISHTWKETERVRSFRGVKRSIIGRFGIGKISLYQMCNNFHILTWQNGLASEASFDFKEFESSDFIDDFKLKVTSEKTKRTGSGTIITLTNLKEEGEDLSARKIKTRLSHTMPLSKTFKITICDKKGRIWVIKSEELKGLRVAQEYPVDEPNVDGIGRVTGTVTFFTNEDPENQGVFIRVFGRLVNFDNPKGVINLNRISHPRNFTNKIRADVNADGLDKALMTNRAGFIESSSEYKQFKDWLERKINSFGEQEYNKWKRIRDQIEKLEVPLAVAEAYSRIADDIPEIWKQKKGHETKRASALQSLLNKGKLKIEAQAMGETKPEAVFDENSGTLLINSTNPSYVFAQTHGRLQSVSYHVFKTVAVLIASELATNIEEFKSIYNAISTDVDLLDRLDAALGRKK